MQRTLAFKIGHWRFGAMVCVAALLLSAARAAAQSLATDPPASALPPSVLSRDAEGHVVVPRDAHDTASHDRRPAGRCGVR